MASPLLDIFFGLSAMLSIGIAVIFFYLFLKKQNDIYFWISFSSVFVLLFSAYLFYYFYTYGLHSWDKAKLQVQGNVIVKEVELYKDNIGHYPLSIQETNITMPHTLFGTWKYRRLYDGTAFELSVGDYRRNGFILYWNSRNEGWGVDA